MFLTGEPIVIYTPPKFTHLLEAEIQLGKESLGTELPCSEWSRARSDAAPDVNVEVLFNVAVAWITYSCHGWCHAQRHIPSSMVGGLMGVLPGNAAV